MWDEDDGYEDTPALEPEVTRKEMDFLAGIAEGYLRMGRPREALSVADGLASIAPLCARGPALRGGFLVRLGRHLEARDAFDKAVQREPLEVANVLELGRASLRIGDHERALLELRRAILLAEHQGDLTLLVRARALLTEAEEEARFERSPELKLARLRMLRRAG